MKWLCEFCNAINAEFASKCHSCGKLRNSYSRKEITISEYLSSRTQLPIDFQIQGRTKANIEFKGTRSALGHDWHPNE